MKKSRSLYCVHVPDQPPSPPGVPRDGWSIKCSKLERDVLDVLQSTKKHFGLSTVPRIAGGWVRDKLLQKESHDVDIALDDCLGEEFALKVNDYLQSLGEQTKTVGVVKANPEQSKHLATAKVKVHGLEIDFVNLRSEVYAQDSRIPTIEIGSPEQDAFRRDFTVNAMFYNCVTEQVEDLTGFGLHDLEHGILRTPLSASITFHDDPLRMLRAIRFASRYGFRLHEELCGALADERNRAELGKKVSNERIGIELEKSLRGQRPSLALQLIINHGLADVVFKVPEMRYLDERVEVPSKVHWLTSLRILKLLPPVRAQDLTSTEFYLAVVLFPLGTSLCVVKKGKKEPVVRYVVINSLKLSNNLADRVQATVAAAHGLIPFLQRPAQPDDRLHIGRLLFQVKDAWADGLEIALAALRAGREYSKDETEYFQRVSHRHDELSRLIRGEWGLDNVWSRVQKQPILDGKSLMELLKIKGADVGKAVDLVHDYAFLHNPDDPEVDDKTYGENAKAFVLERWSTV